MPHRVCRCRTRLETGEHSDDAPSAVPSRVPIKLKYFVNDLFSADVNIYFPPDAATKPALDHRGVLHHNTSLSDCLSCDHEHGLYFFSLRQLSSLGSYC